MAGKKRARVMPTWTVANPKRVCVCGRAYRLEKLSVPMRDKDSIDCACGETLCSWNGGVMYRAQPLPG